MWHQRRWKFNVLEEQQRKLQSLMVNPAGGRAQWVCWGQGGSAWSSGQSWWFFPLVMFVVSIQSAQRTICIWVNRETRLLETKVKHQWAVNPGLQTAAEEHDRGQTPLFFFHIASWLKVVRAAMSSLAICCVELAVGTLAFWMFCFS